jgi:hypothetical protein
MSKYLHRYSVKACPECGHELTQADGVTIEITDGYGNREIPSRLDDIGTVVDEDDVIQDGKHSDTLCGKCRQPLNEYEES